MKTPFIDRKTLSFLLYQVHDVESLCQLPYFQDHSKETFEMILDSATQIAEKLMFPTLTAVDRQEPQLVNGEVTVHPIVKEYLQAMGESGLIGADFSYEHGGAQVPMTITSLAGFIGMAANSGLMYTGLTAGAARLLTTFATEELIQRFVPHMLSGKWQGTMCLTEPQAGSSLSDITTTAIPQPDGTYAIHGQKIFISAGDHDACENVVHLLIGRIQGAPLGTKGISLFVVPKFLEDGTRNDISNMGIYHKIGQKGVPAMHLGFEGSQAWLIGEPNKGLSYMFQMMNEARIGVGIAGAAIASAAYHAALTYAKERPQSRRLNTKAAVDTPQVPIIQHPDVRRMLLFQKAAVEGSLSLLVQTSLYFDRAHAATSSEEKEKNTLLVELLTPITKTYPCEAGVKVTNEALQCFGGYGFTEDFPAEQYYRDIRITPIYEGTTGIQSQDLLGRKVTLQQGKAVQLLAAEVQEVQTAASAIPELARYARQLAETGTLVENVTKHLLSIARTGDVERYLSDASLYMELMSTYVIAWQWLKQAVAAQQLDDEAVKATKWHTLQYFFHYEVPKCQGWATRLTDDTVLTIVGELDIFA